MAHVKVFYEPGTELLTVFWQTPRTDQICTELDDGVIMIKDSTTGEPIGIEILSYHPGDNHCDSGSLETEQMASINSLGNLGNADNGLSQYQQAIELFQQNLAIAREIGDRQGEGIALENLGGTLVKLERYSEALELLQEALKIDQEINFKSGEAETFKKFAELHQALGEIELARQYGQQALALATELGIPLAAECSALLQSLEQIQEE